MEPEDRPDGFQDFEEPVSTAHVQQLVIGDCLLHMQGHIEDRRRNDDHWPAPSERDWPGDAVRDVDPGLDANARFRFAEGGGKSAAARCAGVERVHTRLPSARLRESRRACAQDQESGVMDHGEVAAQRQEKLGPELIPFKKIDGSAIGTSLVSHG